MFSARRQLKGVFRKAVRGKLGLNHARVRVEWVKDATGSRVRDDERTYGEETELSEEVDALVHYVTPESVVARGYVNLAVGDVLVDVEEGLELMNNAGGDFPPGAVFVINERNYVQKVAGAELTKAWDVLVGGAPVWRTFLLTPMEGPRPSEAGE